MTRARNAVVAAGLLGGSVALLAALHAGWYRPAWLESRSPCELAGRCTAADVEEGLRRLWWPVAGGLAVLVLAAVAVAWTLPPRGRERPKRPVPAPVHALTAGVIAFGAAMLAGFPLVFGAFGGAHLLVVVLTGAWLVQAGAVVTAARLARSVLPTPGQQWLAALTISALGTGGVVLTWQVDSEGSLAVLPVVDAVAVASAVLAQRALERLGRPAAWGSLAGGVAVLAAGVLLLVELLTPQPPATPVAAQPPVLPPPSTPSPGPTPAPAPVPTPAPTPEPVDADAPCAQQDLAFRVVGFDGAMGARAAAVEATNTGTTDCWLEGVPVVVLLQGGRPLALQAGTGETPEGTPARVQRVGVAPGGTAYSLLTWRTYGGWADQETPQALTVALDPSTTLVDAALPAGSGPAPFDIADGGAWGIAPWAPPWR